MSALPKPTLVAVARRSGVLDMAANHIYLRAQLGSVPDHMIPDALERAAKEFDSPFGYLVVGRYFADQNVAIPDGLRIRCMAAAEIFVQEGSPEVQAISREVLNNLDTVLPVVDYDDLGIF